MKLKAIKQGKILQIQEDLNLADGEEIIITINDYQLANHNQVHSWEDFEDIIGAWKNDQEISEIFAEIDQQRHQDFGREVEL